MNHPANIRINELNKIAVQAGTKILEIYHDFQHFPEVEYKSDRSPLTLADKASNNIICQYLSEAYPEIPLISEENKEIPYSERKKYEFFWLIDPLDGTKEFISRNGEFTVNIALIYNGYPYLGIVFAPCLNQLYFAEKNKGAFKVCNGQTTGLQVASFSLADENLTIVASRSHANQETDDYIRKFRNVKTTSMGSSLKFMLIASGEAHLYPRTGPTMEWDTAAAHCIVKEAGGKVVEFYSGKNLIYNKENLLNPYFLATGKIIP
ncbi:MAG TPA: 3'(2'),5'-bisphosphate nucleotidase CysQ [Bacteroidia bacterium]|nr:3'(2'),5'-bisphosphate nucleotidase CysQ [Bacteroidia bacterium]HRS57722.1 3'(2'),5'-bisphosphate nucleotidase CysQ [Bacteroidia bacterium]